MPTGRVKLLFRPSSQANALQFRTRIEQALLTHPVARRVIDWSVEDGTAVLDIELTSATVMRNLKQWFADNRDELRALGTGTIKACLCSHADPVIVPCSDAALSEYREVRL